MSYSTDLMDLIATYDGERRTLIERAVAAGLDLYKPGEALLRAWIDLRPMIEPVVVNRHHFADEKSMPRLCTYVGRPTPLSNPFPRDITVSGFRSVAQSRGWPQAQIDANARRFHAREIDVLALYRVDLWLQLKRGRDVSDALSKTPASAAFVCSCATSPVEKKSKPCHAFTLVKAWKWQHETKERAA